MKKKKESGSQKFESEKFVSMIELQLSLQIVELETKKRKIKISAYINGCLSDYYLQKSAVSECCLMRDFP